MKALVTSERNTAVVEDIGIPKPGKRNSVALNPVDALYVAHPPDKPGRVVGSDIAGVVDMVGEGVSEWHIGDRVAGLLQGATSGNPRPGGFAEYAILEQDLAIRIPSAVSLEDAATFPLCSLTAAQALFIRLEINAPFPSPFKFEAPKLDSPALLVHSGATSLGLFTIGLARLIRTPSGNPFRIFATASPKNHEKLLALGVEAVYDYRSPTWPDDLWKATDGGIAYAIDCISEDTSTARISQAFIDSGGKIAVIRKAAFLRESIRKGVTPLYGAVWSGLGHEIIYNNEILPASPSWREFAVQFFKFLSNCHPQDPTTFPIPSNPIRLMPGGLERITPDGLALMGSGKFVDRVSSLKHHGSREWMKPISAEKLVYRVVE